MEIDWIEGIVLGFMGILLCVLTYFSFEEELNRKYNMLRKWRGRGWLPKSVDAYLDEARGP